MKMNEISNISSEKKKLSVIQIIQTKEYLVKDIMESIFIQFQEKLLKQNVLLQKLWIK